MASRTTISRNSRKDLVIAFDRVVATSRLVSRKDKHTRTRGTWTAPCSHAPPFTHSALRALLDPLSRVRRCAAELDGAEELGGSVKYSFVCWQAVSRQKLRCQERRTRCLFAWRRGSSLPSTFSKCTFNTTSGCARWREHSCARRARNAPGPATCVCVSCSILPRQFWHERCGSASYSDQRPARSRRALRS